MLGGHPAFAPALQHCLRLAAELRDDPTPTRRAALLDAIARAIEPVNVGGLADAERHNWYPATAADLLAGAGKLGASAPQVQAMLERCGFWR